MRMPRRPGTWCVAVGAALALAPAGRIAAQQWENFSGPANDPWRGVFDARRGRFVRLGALDGQVWEWGGTAWLQMVTGVPPFGAPVARTGFATAFDSQRGRAYLLGGQAVSVLGDMWYWDGLQFAQISVATPPSRRTRAAMTFDSIRNRIVLFGGEDPPNAVRTDTWEFDGQQWTQILGTGPAWVANARMEFDAARARTVLLSAATWTFDGITWSQVSGEATSPTTRLCQDAVRQRVVLYRNDVQPELREWNGLVWTAMPAPGLPRLSDATLYFDPASNRTILSSASLGGTQLQWDGVALQRQSHSPQCNGQCWFFDPVRGRAVAFGGSRPLVNVDETWTWDGRRWTEMQPANRPPARTNAASTFDTVRGLGLVYGGSSPQGTLRDLWGWNGTDWALLATTGPPALVLPMMAFDSARGRAVLFGGIGSTGLNTQVWEWDGAIWSNVTPAVSPTFSLGSMTFDPVRARCVLYLSVLGAPQTWEWNGSSWAQIVTPAVPSQSGFTSAVFDAQQSRVSIVGPGPSFGVWDFDGLTWTRRAGVPDYASSQPQAVWDSGRQRLVLFDGAAVLELRAPAAESAYFGTSCGAPATVLMLRQQARLGAPDFGLDVAVKPGAIVLFGLSASQANVPLGGGCTVWVGPLFESSIALADARGLASWQLPVPNDIALRGVVAFAQAGALTSGSTLRTSQGIRIVVGE